MNNLEKMKTSENELANITVMEGVHIALFHKEIEFVDGHKFLIDRGLTWGTAKYLVRLATNCSKEKRPFTVMSVYGPNNGFFAILPSLGQEDDEWDMYARKGDTVARGKINAGDRFVVIPTTDWRK